MFDRFERPVKILCLAMALLLAWQLGSLILRGDPLAKLNVPALPTLPGATNEPAKPARKETHGTHVTMGTNTHNGTNVANGTNVVEKSTNTFAGGNTGQANASSALPGRRNGPPPGMMPGMMAQMMGGGMPGGGMGGGMKKVELPPEVQSRVDRIIDSEIFGPIIRPMPMALNGISDQEAFIQATNGQIGAVKLGEEMGGIKLLRIGVNRVLVEQGGETNELTQFGGVGGESLMPIPAKAPFTNTVSTNAPSTNAPTKKASTRKAAANHASISPALSSKEKETP
jgi:hypothetical protein